MRIYIAITMLFATALAGCATTGGVMIEPRDEVAVIAHRGASAYAPENTLAAFELAAEMDADWYELDCLLTKDNVVIVNHDDDLARTTGAEGMVADKTLAELKKLDAGAWFDKKFVGEKMPTLVESLDMAKGRIGVYVEVKGMDNDGDLMEALWQAAEGHDQLDKKLAKEMMDLVEADGTRNLKLAREVIQDIRTTGMTKEVVVQSFSPIICLVTCVEAPELRTEYLGGYDPDKPTDWELFQAWGMFIDVDGFNLSHKSLNPERLKRFHDAGKTVAVWTVNDEADMRKYIQWGVDGIITDKPDVLRDVLTAMQS